LQLPRQVKRVALEVDAFPLQTEQLALARTSPKSRSPAAGQPRPARCPPVDVDRGGDDVARCRGGERLALRGRVRGLVDGEHWVRVERDGALTYCTLHRRAERLVCLLCTAGRGALHRLEHVAHVVDAQSVEALVADVWLDVQPHGEFVVAAGARPRLVLE